MEVETVGVPRLYSMRVDVTNLAICSELTLALTAYSNLPGLQKKSLQAGHDIQHKPSTGDVPILPLSFRTARKTHLALFTTNIQGSGALLSAVPRQHMLTRTPPHR